MLSVELGPGWWVGTEWEAPVVLASELSPPGCLGLSLADYKSQSAMHPGLISDRSYPTGSGAQL